MTKVFKKTFDLLFILIIVVLAGYFILRSCKVIEVYNVKTGSMEEDIHIGDYILIMNKKDYEIGDIITFKRDDYLVTHRVIKKTNNSFVTKGDANNEEDGPITLNQIVGKVIIAGGFLNIIIKYKYALASIFISLYLISCYLFGETENPPETKANENKKEELTKPVEENKIEETKENSNEEVEPPKKRRGRPPKKKTEEEETKPKKVVKKTTEKKETKKRTTKKASTSKAKTTTKKTTTSKKTTSTKKSTTKATTRTKKVSK